MTTATPPTPTTLAGLRASGHRYKAVKHELRDNLLRRLAEGGERFPGIVGFDDTVLPGGRARPARRPRHRAAGRARPGQDPADPLARTTCSTSGRRWSPAASSTTTRTCPPARPAGGGWTSWATSCRWPGGTAPSATARSWPPRTPASATSSATSTRSRWPRAARSATRRPSTTGWCRAPTAASSASTSCPTWPSGSRWRCSTCSRSATSRSAATSCGCRSTCC